MTPRHQAGEGRILDGWDRGFPAGLGSVMTAGSVGYRGLLGARAWLHARGVLRSRSAGVPVASIGNLTVGGTGKTPAVLLAVQTLLDLGHRPVVVSRGYGRRGHGVRVVADAASIRLDAEDAGDEPFLLARRLPGVPVVVSSNRYEAARLAVARFGATVIVLDDGFQHLTLAKDLEIVMARAGRPWGNGRLLPAGPLREPLDGLARADLVVAAGAARLEDASEVIAAARVHAPGVSVLTAVYVATECWEAARMQPVKLEELAGRRLVAFAGIGTPGRFGETLRSLGAIVDMLWSFPDHHWYSRSDLARLAARAQEAGADGLVTTEKDWARLRRIAPPPVRLYVLSVRLELTSGEAEWRSAFERACPNR